MSIKKFTPSNLKKKMILKIIGYIFVEKYQK
jgi:hypothetical protein